MSDKEFFMKERSLLTSSEIMELSNNYFDNLAIVIEHCSASDLEIRLTALEKLADEFPPSMFVSKYYPRDEVFNLYRNAIKSDSHDEVTEAFAAVTEIDCSLAREMCLRNLNHRNTEVREEVICCLGYVGVESDSELLTSLMENESNELLKVAAFNSLVRLGHDELLNTDKINLSKLNIDACVSILENLCSLTDRYDLAKTYRTIFNLIGNLNNDAINEELFDLKLRIDKEAIFNVIQAIFSHYKIDWEKVIELLENSDSDIRFKALNNIGSGSKPNKKAMPSKPPKQVFDKIVLLVEDNDDEVRAEAISVLGDWEYIESIDLIAEHLHDESELVRLDAIYALGEIGGKKALQYLNELNIKEYSEVEKARLYQAFIRCGRKEFFETWIKCLKSNDALVRANVAGGVWSIWNSDFHTTLESELAIAKDKETHKYVLDEIDDSLNWLISKN